MVSVDTFRAEEEARQIRDIAERSRFRFVNEDDLQQGLTQAISSAGMVVEREVRLSARDRVDLLVGRVGVEVKVAGAPSAVQRQLERYAESDRVDALVLVTTRLAHSSAAPHRANGKPVHVVCLGWRGL